MAKMKKQQKRLIMYGLGGIALVSLYKMNRTGLGLGFLTLPYEYAPSAPSYSYNQMTPSFNEYSYNPYPVKFASDNRSPFEDDFTQIPSMSSKMSDEAFLNIVRQISETDNVEVIENATSMSSTPTLANGASLRDLRVVKSQVDNTIGSSRITSDQKNYLMAIQSLLSERIVALTPVDTEAIGGIF